MLSSATHDDTGRRSGRHLRHSPGRGPWIVVVAMRSSASGTVEPRFTGCKSLGITLSAQCTVVGVVDAGTDGERHDQGERRATAPAVQAIGNS